MRNKIIIGEHNENNIPSGGMCIWKNADISENDLFYLLHNKTIKTKLYVSKDSEEGQSLKEWLENEENRNNESVNRKALELLSSHMEANEVMQVYDIKEEEGYARGYADAQRDIRKALGIE